MSQFSKKLQIEYNKLQNEINELKLKRDNEIKSVDDLIKKIELIKDEKKKFQSKFEKKIKRINETEQTISSINETNYHLETSIQKFNENLSELNIKYNKMKEKLEKTKLTHKEFIDDYTNKWLEHKAFREKMPLKNFDLYLEKKDALKNSDEKIVNLREQLNQLRKENKDMKENQDELKSKYGICVSSKQTAIELAKLYSDGNILRKTLKKELNILKVNESVNKMKKSIIKQPNTFTRFQVPKEQPPAKKKQKVIFDNDKESKKDGSNFLTNESENNNYSDDFFTKNSNKFQAFKSPINVTTIIGNASRFDDDNTQYIPQNSFNIQNSLGEFEKSKINTAKDVEVEILDNQNDFISNDEIQIISNSKTPSNKKVEQNQENFDRQQIKTFQMQQVPKMITNSKTNKEINRSILQEQTPMGSEIYKKQMNSFPSEYSPAISGKNFFFDSQESMDIEEIPNREAFRNKETTPMHFLMNSQESSNVERQPDTDIFRTPTQPFRFQQNPTMSINSFPTNSQETSKTLQTPYASSRFSPWTYEKLSNCDSPRFSLGGQGDENNANEQDCFSIFDENKSSNNSNTNKSNFQFNF